MIFPSLTFIIASSQERRFFQFHSHLKNAPGHLAEVKRLSPAWINKAFFLSTAFSKNGMHSFNKYLLSILSHGQAPCYIYELIILQKRWGHPHFTWKTPRILLVKQQAWSHTAGKWQSQDWKQVCPAPNSITLLTLLPIPTPPTLSVSSVLPQPHLKTREGPSSTVGQLSERDI